MKTIYSQKHLPLKLHVLNGVCPIMTTLPSIGPRNVRHPVIKLGLKLFKVVLHYLHKWQFLARSQISKLAIRF